MIYLYAITELPAVPDGQCRGIDDLPVRHRSVSDLGAVVTCDIAGAPRPVAEQVWRHEQVVERFMGLCSAVLPARFGTVYENDEALASSLQQHHQELRDGLARVRDHVELGIRVAWDRAPTEVPDVRAALPSATGRQYMLDRARQERDRHQLEKDAGVLADAVHKLLTALASDHTRRLLATPRLPLSAAYLVPVDRLDVFRDEVERLASLHPDAQVLCTGPWPPYHFVPRLELREPNYA